MMTGIVHDLHLLLPLNFIGEDGLQRVREIVVDTGFTGGLSLPIEMIEDLKIPFFRRLKAELADGEENEYPAYFATVRWHDRVLEVVTYELGRRPLLGMALLDGSTMHVDFTDNEMFTIEEN